MCNVQLTHRQMLWGWFFLTIHFKVLCMKLRKSAWVFASQLYHMAVQHLAVSLLRHSAWLPCFSSFNLNSFCVHGCESVKFPGTGVKESCEQPCECRELNPESSGRAASALPSQCSAICPALLFPHLKTWTTGRFLLEMNNIWTVFYRVWCVENVL